MGPESIQMLQDAAYAVMALLVVATIYTLISPMFGQNKLQKRMQSVSAARENLRENRLNQLGVERAQRQSLRGETKNIVKTLVDNLSLEKLLAASDLRDKIAQAGLRGQRPIYLFYFFRLATPLVLAFLGVVFLIVLNIMGWTFNQNLLATFCLLAFGYYSPGIYLKNRATKRLKKIEPSFPDALDLLLICVESGMSAEVAFTRVAKEMAANSVELAEELSLTTAELSYLQSRRVAYENLARRNKHEGIRSVSTALIQAERYGTPLGETLRVLAAENREMRMLAAEKKAASLPAKLTVPMIVFFLPVLFIVILTPAGMSLKGAF